MLCMAPNTQCVRRECLHCFFLDTLIALPCVNIIIVCAYVITMIIIIIIIVIIIIIIIIIMVIMMIIMMIVMTMKQNYDDK